LNRYQEYLTPNHIFMPSYTVRYTVDVVLQFNYLYQYYCTLFLFQRTTENDVIRVITVSVCCLLVVCRMSCFGKLECWTRNRIFCRNGEKM